MAPGPITVVSHSLGIDPESPRFELARALEGSWKYDDPVDRRTGKLALREDPNGYFVVEVDEAERRIVAEHRFEGLLLKEYRSASAERIAREVSADMAVSLPSHALWLGRQLEKAERALRESATG
jgi:thymidylate synthase